MCVSKALFSFLKLFGFSKYKMAAYTLKLSDSKMPNNSIEDTEVASATKDWNILSPIDMLNMTVQELKFLVRDQQSHLAEDHVVQIPKTNSSSIDDVNSDEISIYPDKHDSMGNHSEIQKARLFPPRDRFNCIR
jgi:hypothetical protein